MAAKSTAFRGKRPRNCLETLLTNFGQNFRAVRLRLGYESQSAFAARHGYSNSYISRLERGEMLLRFAAMVEIANHVDMDVLDLLRPPPTDA